MYGSAKTTGTMANSAIAGSSGGDTNVTNTAPTQFPIQTSVIDCSIPVAPSQPQRDRQHDTLREPTAQKTSNHGDRSTQMYSIRGSAMAALAHRAR